jgi:radical SAM protein with 4Fe4S-binding SPASM domain
MLEKIIIFNPYYYIHHDINRTFILNDNFIQVDSKIAKSEFHALIHPVHAMFLSFFNGNKKLKHIIPSLCNFFDLTTDEIIEKIEMFYYNKDINVEYDNHVFSLPNNLLIDKQYISRKSTPDPSDFFISREDLNILQPRFNKPFCFTIVINNTCLTNCVYCYADKTQHYKNTISTEQYREIIQEAHKLGINQIDITGGELFYYNDWYNLLASLKEYNYYSYISTKIPLDEEQIIKLKELGYRFIQFSLDSIDPKILTELLDVEHNYISKINNTLKNLEKHGFRVTINTVLTNKNAENKHLNNLLQFLDQFENVKDIQFAIMEYSINSSYKKYKDYKLTQEEIDQLKSYVDTLESSFPKKNISLAGFSERKEYIASFDKKKESFNQRSLCTGNFNRFFILPNGDVTICEELYFREKFIIGNLLNNTIEGVWNSDKAKNLFYLKDTFHDSNSICKDCETIEECRISGYGVCWKEVIGAYGEDKISYPDPRCPYAPSFDKEVYY